QIGPGPEAAAAFGIARVVDAATLDAEISAAMAGPAVLARMREGKRLKVYTVLPVGPEAVFSRDRAFAERVADLTAGRMQDVVDIGAEDGYYTADITRTWPASGKFTDRQRAIYSLVLEAQTAAARAYKPGMAMRDLYNVAVETMRASPLRDKSGKTLDTAFIT